MGAKHEFKESHAAETTLRQEIASLADDDVFEMANLTSKQTGIDGIIFISTAMGSHGPRVKYFQKAGKDQPSFSVSVSSPPRVLAGSLPLRVSARMAPAVIAWVKLNRGELLNFWNEGDSWTHDEVNAFIGRLKKLPKSS